MSEPKRYGRCGLTLDELTEESFAECAEGQLGSELARDLLAAQARIGELERELDNERMTGGPCAVCAGSGMLLTDEECRVCAGSGSAHQESHGLRVLAQTGERRIAELEATIARVRDLPARWRPDGEMYTWNELDVEINKCADELESALATPGKAMGE